MIDIGSLAAGALWILGLALLLAALSWANWVATRERIPFRSALGHPGVRRAVDGGLVLFCVGLAAAGQTGWERALWGVLAAGFGALAIWEEWMDRRKNGRAYVGFQAKRAYGFVGQLLAGVLRASPQDRYERHGRGICSDPRAESPVETPGVERTGDEG